MLDHNLTLPKTLQSSTILDALISVRKDRLLYANQHEHDYFVVTSAEESVVVVATAPDGQLLVTKEYRHPIKRVVLGLPGGMMNKGESAVVAARRELLEETGCSAQEYFLLGSVYPLPGLLAQKMHIVHAKGAQKIHPTDLEASETLESAFMSTHEIQEKLKNGLDVDGVFCSAIYFYSLYEAN